MSLKAKRISLAFTSAAVLALAGFVGGAQAATATSNLSVGATVAATCTISTATLTFGSYDFATNASTPLNASGSVTTTCTGGSAVNITLGQGANAGGGSTPAVPLRRMASGGNFLGYTLYSDSGRTTVWGDTAPTGKADTGTGTTSTLTVYGSVTAGQNLPVGSYVDTVVATVTY